MLVACRLAGLSALEPIFVTEEAFEAIKATLPMGSMAFEPEVAKGERLAAMRGPVPGVIYGRIAGRSHGKDVRAAT
jgi:hypothetical protein